MRARSIKTFVFVFAVMLVWATAAYASKVSITVMDGMTPVANADVEVFDEDGNKVAEGTTDARGKFKTDLPDGKYTFKAKKGNKTDEQEGDAQSKTADVLFLEEEGSDEQAAAFIPIQVDSQQRYLITLLPGVDAAQWIADHDLPAEAYYFQTIACPEDVQFLSGIGGKRNTTPAARWRARGLHLERSAFAAPVGLTAKGDSRDAVQEAERTLAGLDDEIDREQISTLPIVGRDDITNLIPDDCWKQTIQTPLMGGNFAAFSQQYCNAANGVSFCGVDTCPSWQFPAVVKPTAVAAREHPIPTSSRSC